MLRTFSCGPSVTKGQLFLVHLSSCLCSPFFIHFVIPDYFVLTTSIYFSTFSVLHVRSTEPVSIHKRTRSLEGVWPTGRLVVSTDRRMMRDLEHKETCCKYTNHQYMQKVFQNVQKKLGRSPIHATFSVESYKTNVSTWRLLWHRRWKLL